ncbi:MRL1 [Symbiodinium natans]|uniref:MRL1 protein n=1 Tax=Symbiodinium natans TaxID=878477 RepID=A0A812QKC0_9DINO|nr:MRL1 [Symbiodinium natans]
MMQLVAMLRLFQGNVVTYSAALAACADAAQWPAACQLFWNMVNASVEANTVTFGAATSAFAAADWRLAMSMLSMMVQEAVRINTVVLLAALEACASAGQSESILALSTEMSDAGVPIDAETCSAMVAACDFRRPRRAAMLLATASEDGLRQLRKAVS